MAVEFLAFPKPDQKGEEPEEKGRFIDLSWMDSVGMCGVPYGELYSPREITGLSVAAAGHEAAYATECVTEWNTGRHDVCEFPEREFLLTCEENECDGGTYQPAVENESSADEDHLAEWLAGEFLFPVGNDKEQTGTNDSTCHDPESGVGDDLRRNPFFHGSPTGGPKANNESDRHEHAVPMDGETSEFEGDGIHD